MSPIKQIIKLINYAVHLKLISCQLQLQNNNKYKINKNKINYIFFKKHFYIIFRIVLIMTTLDCKDRHYFPHLANIKVED